MKALFVHDGYFPEGSAFASRLYYMAEMFLYCGFEVHVIAAYSKDKSIKPNNVYKTGDITYQITDVSNRGSIDTFVGPRNFLKTLRHYIKENKIDVVITSRGITYYSALNHECKRKSVKLYVEQCEWLDVASFKFGILDPRFLKMNKLLTKGYRSSDGIIAISRLLEEHFKKQGIKTIRIPTIMDVLNTSFSFETQNKKTVIVFTGSLGNHKELLYPILKVMSENKAFQESIEFHIYGPTKEQVAANVEEPELLNTLSNIFIHGFVSHDDVQAAIRNADFQYFIRPNRRSSNAGFPTKLGESLSCATPCITNDTGDISVYLKDGVNSYIVNEDFAISLKVILDNIVRQSTEVRRMMRVAARRTAEEAFDIRKYSETIKEFLEI